MSDLFQSVSVKRLRIVRALALIALIVGCISVANGQALPTAEASGASTGFSLPTAAGDLTYSVSASQSVNWGFYSNSGHSASSNVSGNLAYISNSKRNPFSALAAAGRSFGYSGQPSYNFVSAGVSQVLGWRRWNFVVADNASYLPQTPTSGFAGVPGLGDLGIGLGSIGAFGSLGTVPSSVIAPPSQGVLTRYATRIDNSVSASVQRDFTAKTGIHGSASSALTRYTNSANLALGNQGLDSDGISASGGINHQYSQRNVVGGNFSYSNYTFTTSKNPAIVTPDFASQVVSIYYAHQFNRRLSLTVAAGPEWTTVTLGKETRTLNTFANVSTTYLTPTWAWALAYVRATNSGYGVIGGSLANSVTLSANRKISRVWAASFSGSYNQSTSLPSPSLPYYTFHTAVVSGQLSRALSHNLSAYGSYSMQSQSNHGPVLTVLNAFSGHYQTLGVGITYAPRAIHFGAR